MNPIIIAAIITASAGIIAAITSKILDISKDNKRRKVEEIDFLNSYFKVFSEEAPMSFTHLDVINQHFKKISDEIVLLAANNDWETLIGLKKRLREYFEFSGKYKEGIEFGNSYFEVFKKKEKIEEAIWVKLKDIGYLEILNENYQKGRKDINKALEMLSASSTIKTEIANECYFYCYRYIGISFLRDRANRDLDKCEELFKKAEEIANLFERNSTKWLELKGRIFGNLGNLEIEKGNSIKALELYRESLKFYSLLKQKGLIDIEHLSIAHLKIVEALLEQGNTSNEIEIELEKSLRGCLSIGWREGEGRIYEQYARHYLNKAMNIKCNSQGDYLSQAHVYAERTLEIYQSMKLHEAIGRIKELQSAIKNIGLSRLK